MTPPPEYVHWLFASGFLTLGLFLLAEAVVGPAIWGRRRWRLYLWPGTFFGMGLFMWPVMVFYTSSTLHMIAHGCWAEVMMLGGAAELGLATGKLKSQYWRLMMFAAFVVTGAAFLVHEQLPWFFQRSAFLHHLLGWTFLAASIFPLGRALRPRRMIFVGGLALSLVVVGIMLYSDRDVAPVFGHLSPLAGTPHR
jgi:hypothetical protein